MDYLHHNIVQLVSAMRRADATYAFVDYNVYKYMSMPGDVRVQWRHEATLLVTDINAAIEPVYLMVPDWDAKTNKSELTFKEGTLPFASALLEIFAQVRTIRYRSGQGLYDGGGGAFHVTSKGLAFLDYDQHIEGAELTRIWSHQV